MSDILERASWATPLTGSMQLDFYTTYGYKNAVELSITGIAKSAGGAVHFIIESTTMADAAALTTAGYGSAPACSLLFATNSGGGADATAFFGKEEDGDNKWAAFTMGNQG